MQVKNNYNCCLSYRYFDIVLHMSQYDDRVQKYIDAQSYFISMFPVKGKNVIYTVLSIKKFQCSILNCRQIAFK